MMSLAAIPALAIVAFAAAFHFHWAFGGKRGFDISLPQRPDGEPVMRHRLHWWRPAAFAVGLGLVVLGLLVLDRAHGWQPTLIPLDLGLRVTGAAFIARALVPNRYVGFFKTLRTTRWARWDTRLYSPLFLVLGVALIAVSLS